MTSCAHSLSENVIAFNHMAEDTTYAHSFHTDESQPCKLHYFTNSRLQEKHYPDKSLRKKFEL